MNLDYYKFSSKLEKLYFETLKTYPELSFDIRIVPDDEVDKSIDCSKGACEYIKSEKRYDIRIGESYVNEEIISHELLHVYLRKLGFLGIRSFYTDPAHVVYTISRNIGNAIDHSFIYPEQIRRGIKPDIYSYSITLGQNIKRESPDPKKQILFSLNIFEAYVRGGFSNTVYEQRIKELTPNSYKYFLRIREIFLKSNTDTPFNCRKCKINIIKEFDSIINEVLSIKERLNLNLHIGVGFIPSKRQMDNTIEQLFDLIAFGDSNYALISKRDKQVAYHITVDSRNEKRLKNATFREFIKMIQERVTIRD